MDRSSAVAHYMEQARAAVAEGERRLRESRTHPPAREPVYEMPTFNDVQRDERVALTTAIEHLAIAHGHVDELVGISDTPGVRYGAREWRDALERVLGEMRDTLTVLETSYGS